MIIKALCVIGAKAKDGTSPLWPGCLYDVDDSTAERLIEQDCAVPGKISARPALADAIPSENPPEGDNAPEGPSEGENGDIDFEAMSFNELKALAKDMGIETGKIKSKAGMIDAITAAMDPGDGMPDLTPQDVIEE